MRWPGKVRTLHARAGTAGSASTRVLRACWLALTACGGAHAAAIATDMIPTRWTVADGAPADIWTLGAAPEGRLWLGTGLGLYRFDGVRFERYALRDGQQLRSSNINALLATPDGDIWLGFYTGGVARLRDGRVREFGATDGLPPGRVLHFASTPDGTLWVAAGSGLARLAGERWVRVGADEGYTDGGAEYVFTDSRGVLWVCGRNALAYRLPAERRFRSAPLRTSPSAIVAEDRSGRIWLSDDAGGTRPVTDTLGRIAPIAAPSPADDMRGAVAKQLLFAADDSLWLTSVEGGVRRLQGASAVPIAHALSPRGDAMESFDARDGLPSDTAVPLAADAEGGVWVGTNYGLAGFRQRRLHPVAQLAGALRNGYALAPLGAGVAARGRDGNLLLDPPLPPQALPGTPDSLALLRAADGSLWSAGPGGVWRESGPRRLRAMLADGDGALQAEAAAADPAGGLWIAAHERGLFHVDAQGQAAQAGQPPCAPAAVNALGVDTDGALWLACADALVVRTRGGSRRFGPAQGLRVGHVTAIQQTSSGLYVAGEAGFARLQGAAFATLDARAAPFLAGVSGIVEDEDGGLWLNGGQGVVHLRRAALQRLGEDAHGPDVQLFDSRDGLPGIALQATVTQSAVRDAQGRLWFATNRGVVWLDPRRIRLNTRPPGVEISGISTGERAFSPEQDMILPAGTRSLTMRFTALTLASAERARFRYALDGMDAQWHDLGTHAEVVLGNLAPGAYRLRVLAANADGVWGERPTELAFAIAPTFWQSRLFVVACSALLLAAACLAYVLRTGALARRLRMRLEERHGERERIARELHDTLLQGFQGLILSFHAASADVAEPATRALVERTLRNAEGALMEGRDRVRLLRTAVATSEDLELELWRAARELLGGADDAACAGPAAQAPATAPAQPLADTGAFRLMVSGARRLVDPLVLDALLCIAREALTNAVRHAGSRTIAIEIEFGADAMRVRIRDEGAGIPQDVLQRGHRDGHYGLRGMRERAAAIGARLEISSQPQRGTEVLVEVPARRAYLSVVRGRWQAMRRRLAGHP